MIYVFLLITNLAWAKVPAAAYYGNNEKITIEQSYRMQDKLEIESLKSSISQDNEHLKKIEDEGTHAQDYKTISSNLKKRKKRLVELEKKLNLKK